MRHPLTMAMPACFMLTEFVSQERFNADTPSALITMRHLEAWQPRNSTSIT